MKTVLVTGANCFIGRNLVSYLENSNEIKVLKFDLGNTMDELDDFVNQADFIFHLAGINRPEKNSEFDEGNFGFTDKLTDFILQKNKAVPFLMTSSVQALMDNSYGSSKRKAEECVDKYGKISGAPVYIYRLPNVFGKWCRPNYNSVVATFCHNIANDLPIEIHDTEKELTLVYIDDVITEFCNALNGKVLPGADGYCHMDRRFNITLDKLAFIIKGFSESRKSLLIPGFTSDLERFLYATYVSYLPENSFGYDLKMNHDNRGWLAEFIKCDSFGQIFISRTKPGITRGNHWHHTKVEKFLVIQGDAIIKLRQIHGTKAFEYKVSGDKLTVLDIPVGYTHSITNVGSTDVITLFWSDQLFNPEKTDTCYLEA